MQLNLQPTIQSIPPYLLTSLAILVAVIAGQVLMRFVLGRVVFLIAKRKYLPVYLQQMRDGWSDDGSRQSLGAVSEFVAQRLKNRLGSSYSVAEDARSVLHLVQANIGGEGKASQAVYSFSLLKFVQCSLLAFSDLEREFGRHRWFLILRRLRFDGFLRMTRMAGSYNRLPHHRFLMWIREMPLGWRIPTLLLVPLLGPPLFIVYIVRTFLITTLLEGPVRLVYGLFLLRLGYYALYLYHRKNRVIANRLAAISTVELSQQASEFDERLYPKNWRQRSGRFPAAVTCYERMLKEFGLPEDPIASAGENRPGTALRQVGVALRKVARKQGLREKSVDDSHQLVRLLRELGQVYFPTDPHPWLRLRLGEILDVGYMATVLALHKATSVPGGRHLLDNITLNIVLNLNRLSDEASIGRVGISAAKTIQRVHSQARKVNQVWSAVVGRTFPAALAVNLAGEVALQKVSDHYRGFVYHRVGRLLLYVFERNTLRQLTKGARPLF